ncbi:MAG: NAD(P)/FAD-dependent oxidoreductase [Acholeplasmataceae bacterium]|nr:MAG: NAD(P)/FAD-dependent oxidoreductase [Acholeplasmataceae bacterium]
MSKHTIIVGAGISGLTAAAYLCNEGHSVTLVEKSDELGGLIGGFNRDGFIFDHGIRGVENSGTLFPMLRQLGIHVDFLPNIVDMGIGSKIISIDPRENYQTYKDLLLAFYPDEAASIDKIFKDIKKISKYMKVLYDIDNPLFLNPKTDAKYLMKTILPWMFQYTFTIGKIEKLKTPIRAYLRRYTNNPDLIDAISQHFFTDTPTFFALSYLKMHSDYYYPKGGTRSIVKALKDFIIAKGGVIKTNSEIDKIDIDRQVAYHKDTAYPYDALLWCGDLNAMYRSIQNTSIDYHETKKRLEQAKGNDSIYQMYMTVDLPKTYFQDKFSGHLFYMPTQKGLSTLAMTEQALIAHLSGLDEKQQVEVLFQWLTDFARLTTYEISVPVVRDETLAPENQSSVIISTLFSYELTKWIQTSGLYDVFKKHLSQAIIDVLERTLLPGWQSKIINDFEATPLTIENRLNNTNGAITGWSFKGEIPVEHKLFKIAKSIKTPFPNVFQSSHWSFSPSGFPTSIVTAKLAANKIHKLVK